MGWFTKPFLSIKQAAEFEKEEIKQELERLRSRQREIEKESRVNQQNFEKMKIENEKLKRKVSENQRSVSKIGEFGELSTTKPSTVNKFFQILKIASKRIQHVPPVDPKFLGRIK